MTDATNARKVGLTRTLVSRRAMDLTHRRFLSLIDQVELALVVEVLTGMSGDIDITDAWLCVLSKHNHAPVSYDDPEQNWQHEPYTTFRQEALTVMARLEDLAAGRTVAEDAFERYPDIVDEESASKRYLDTLLSQAASMVSFVYGSSFPYDGDDLLGHLDWNASYELRRHFAEQWFDGTYALGYAMMDQPGTGLSAVGDYNEQLAFIRSLAVIVLDATAHFRNGNMGEDLRMTYGHIIAFFAPMLKATVLWATEDTNSPLRIVKEGDDIVDMVSHALSAGGQNYADAQNGIRLVHHGWSEDGQRAARTPTNELVAAFSDRIENERKLNVSIPL